MATSINSYSVSLGMDASGYINGASLSRSETRALIRDIEAARTPSEQFFNSLDRLEKAYTSGAIKLDVYQRLLDEERKKLDATNPVLKERAALMEKGAAMNLANIGPLEAFRRNTAELNQLHAMGAISAGTYQAELGKAKWELWSAGAAKYSVALSPIAIALGAVAAGTTAAAAATVAFVSHMKETQNRIDDVADSAKKLGVTYNELTALRFAGQEAGGLDPATVDASLKKMQINIANALDDPKNEVNAAFKRLGVNAGELMKAGPLEAVKLLADGMQGVNSQADKLALAMQVFGKSGTEMVALLSDGRDAISESVDFQIYWNGLTDAQTVAVAASNDAWDRISVVIDGISTKMAAEMAPAFLVISESVLSTLTGVESLDANMQFVVNTTAAYLGQLKDIAEIFASMPGAVLGQGISPEAFDLRSGERAMQAIIDKRAELERRAEGEIQARKENYERMMAEERESKAVSAVKKRDNTAYFAMIDRVNAEEQKRIDAENRIAQQALKNAESKFAKEREEAKRIRDEIAKGPQSIESGSADAAKFMADQVNAAIAATASPDQAVPTDEQLVAEAQRQRELAEQSAARDEAMLAELRKIADKKPDVVRFR